MLSVLCGASQMGGFSHSEALYFTFPPPQYASLQLVGLLSAD